MYYKIYPDVLFLANLLMDYTVLSVCSRLCKINTTYARLAAAAFLGAVWSVFMVVCTSGGIAVLFCTYLGLPVAMLYVSGCKGRPGEWVYRYAVFMGVSVLIGGLMGQLKERGGSVFAAMVTVVLFAQLAVPLIRYLTGYVKRKNLLYRVMIELDGRSVEMMGLYDTGNSLTDPYNGESVCIVEKKAVDELVQSKSEDKGLRLIPYMSLGNEHGLMKLITVDNISIEYNDRHICHRRQELALYEGSLSKRGEYSMILNAPSLTRK